MTAGPERRKPLRVLVTRPQPDADRFAALLADRGMEGIVAPLLRILSMDEVPDLAGVTGFLFTSANGVRAFAAHAGTPAGMPAALRTLPAYCVGPGTAAVAEEAGFAHVDAAGGDVTSLAERVAERAVPGDGILLHAAGRDRAGDLAALLAARGFRVRRAVLYRAEPVEALPDAARRALAAEAVDAAVFFSPRTARAFASLAADAELAAQCGGVVAVCLSEAVADRLRAEQRVPWREVRVAKRPVLTCLLDTLQAVAAPGDDPAPTYRHRDRHPR